ncbi:RNA polymerase sigma factor (sigma-70 family) [Actinoplanes octamycinicus]|uniref:RNA polymerase sigma factor (Sigma-70 family) n=1 Tax=Actinoplanes octamycinicus TaxID=135948 RepID=A0A7W7H093_9ACTN|nr:sigma-70 family RNA polymerase sigma factor [Actinoplanes octamycinicus]MBB4741581.1 RNA polymerase sigma factor (sigma-70 family) [Actinoplanes octamycinicus]GIE57133.1 RNA polymerase sigma factor [Actinoplanes octamycinicus]
MTAAAAPTPDEVAGWLRAAADGDRAAWAQIVHRYANLVWSIAGSFRLDAADVADVSQMTWLRLVEHLGRIRRPERLGAWLAATARRESINVLRRRESPAAEHTFVNLLDDGPPPGQEIVLADRDRELWTAFARISDRCQALLRLLVVDPPSGGYAEAADRLDMPVGSLGPTRARCLTALRAALSETAATP